MPYFRIRRKLDPTCELHRTSKRFLASLHSAEAELFAQLLRDRDESGRGPAKDFCEERGYSRGVASQVIVLPDLWSALAYDVLVGPDEEPARHALARWYLVEGDEITARLLYACMRVVVEPWGKRRFCGLQFRRGEGAESPWDQEALVALTQRLGKLWLDHCQ